MTKKNRNKVPEIGLEQRKNSVNIEAGLVGVPDFSLLYKILTSRKKSKESSISFVLPPVYYPRKY